MSFCWNKEGKRSFEEIKEAIVAILTLINTNYDNKFMLNSFGSIDTISAMLVQQNEEGLE